MNVLGKTLTIRSHSCGPCSYMLYWLSNSAYLSRTYVLLIIVPLFIDLLLWAPLFSPLNQLYVRTCYPVFPVRSTCLKGGELSPCTGFADLNRERRTHQKSVLLVWRADADDLYYRKEFRSSSLIAGSSKQLVYSCKWRMASSWMLHRVDLVRTDVSKELSASVIKVTIIGELRTTLA
jgi:hypothetical protein